jgi:hypothetical protein
MSEQLPSAPQEPPQKAKALTPGQIGAGAGAALTALILFALRDLWAQGEWGHLSGLFIGVSAGLGAILGLAVVSLVNRIRHRNRQGGAGDRAAGEKTGAAVQNALAPGGQRERNGSPILRGAAGLLALMFAGALVLMIAQGNLRWDGGVLIAALVALLGWYAVRGNKGFPQSLTKK